jgi:hypothetical protein
MNEIKTVHMRQADLESEEFTKAVSFPRFFPARMSSTLRRLVPAIELMPGEYLIMIKRIKPNESGRWRECIVAKTESCPPCPTK